MWLSLRNLPVFLTVCALSAGVLASQADETTLSENTGAENPGAENTGTENTEPAAPPAEQVLNNVLDKLDTMQTFSCNVRETVVLSGQRFVGAGRFLQGSGNRTRLEFRILPVRAVRNSDAAALALDAAEEADDADDSGAAITQVNDGNVMYTYWQNGPDQRVTRRNLQEILKVAEQQETYGKRRAMSDLGMGGIRALISRLQTLMEFAATTEETIGDRKYFVLPGRWSKETRTDIFGIPDPDAVLPPHVPEFVRLYVDAETMLVRRVQYLKRVPDGTEKRMVQPIVNLDFRNIELNGTLPENAFVFTTPEDITEEDVTQNVIEAVEGMSDSDGTP